MVRSKEKKELSFSKVPGNDRNLADIHLALYDDVIVFDHVEKVLIFACWSSMLVPVISICHIIKILLSTAFSFFFFFFFDNILST